MTRGWPGIGEGFMWESLAVKGERAIIVKKNS